MNNYNIDDKQFPNAYKFSSKEERNIASAHLPHKDNTFIYYLVTDSESNYKQTSNFLQDTQHRYYWNLSKHLLDRFDEITNYEFIVIDPDFVKNMRNYLPAGSPLGKRYLWCVDQEHFNNVKTAHLTIDGSTEYDGLKYFKSYERLSEYILKSIHQKAIYIMSDRAANGLRYLIDQIQLVVDYNIDTEAVFFDDKEHILRPYSDNVELVESAYYTHVNNKPSVHTSFEDIAKWQSDKEMLFDEIEKAKIAVKEVQQTTTVHQHKFPFEQWQSFLSFKTSKEAKFIVTETTKTVVEVKEKFFSDFILNANAKHSGNKSKFNPNTTTTFEYPILTMVKPPRPSLVYRAPRRFKGLEEFQYLFIEDVVIHINKHTGAILNIENKGLFYDKSDMVKDGPAPHVLTMIATDAKMYPEYTTELSNKLRINILNR